MLLMSVLTSLSLFHSFVFICFLFFFCSAVVLDLDLPEGEGRKTALGEAPRNRCRPASALCPDMARGENQMSTSTDNNACSRLSLLYHIREKCVFLTQAPKVRNYETGR